MDELEAEPGAFATAFNGLSQSLVDVDVDKLFPLLNEHGKKGPGSMMIVSSGQDDNIVKQMRAMLEGDQSGYIVHELPVDDSWPTIMVSPSDYDPPADVTEDCRPEVMILCAGDRNNVGLNAAIAAVLSKAFDVREERIGFGLTRRVPMFEPDMFFFPTCYDVEFRWTPLHLKLSEEGTKMKLERQQQRRKALHKFHEKKRAKRGKEHAKQKHKGVSRYS